MRFFKIAQDEPEWSFPEAEHDYDPGWDYDVDESPDEELKAYTESVIEEINSKIMPVVDMEMAKAAYLTLEDRGIAVYISGTAPYPVFGIDIKAIAKACENMCGEYGGDVCVEVRIGIRSSLMHELGHAIQDWMDLPMDEEQAENFARIYCDTGEIMTLNGNSE